MPRAINQDFVFRALKKGTGIKDTTAEIEKAKRGNEEYADSAGEVSRSSSAASSALGKLGDAAKGIGGFFASKFTFDISDVGNALQAIGEQFLAQEDTMRKFSAQTGITGAALNDFRDTAQNLYLAGIGSSFEEVAGALQTVHTLTGAVDNEMSNDLTNMTRRAVRFANVFDVDIAEGIRTADTIATNFGISGSAAFDLLTAGIQQTGDPAGDLLDTFVEYSPNFNQLGIDAAGMLGILNSGLEAGARNTDDVADGIREFGIRLQDGTADLGLWRLGLDGMKQDWINGKVSGEDFFNAVIQGLNEIESPLERNRAGVELFGTKWEDAGSQVFLALDTGTSQMSDFIGKTDEAGKIIESGPGQAMELFKRNSIAAIQDGAINALDNFILKIPDALTGWQTFSDSIKILPEAIQTFVTGKASELLTGFITQLANVPILTTAINIGAKIVTGISSGISSTVGIAEGILAAASNISGIFEAGWSAASDFLNGFINSLANGDFSGALEGMLEFGASAANAVLNGLSAIATGLIDMINEALPNELDFGSFKVDLGFTQQTIKFNFDIPDNPVPGGSRDTGGPAFPGNIYEIGKGPYQEFFVPSVPGQVMTPAQMGAGGGGLMLNGNFNFVGVQDPREMERQLGGLAQRKNRAKAGRR